MTSGQLKIVKRAAANLEIETLDYPRYSGRGMYGRETAGLSVDCRADYDLLMERLKKLQLFAPRSDNLGMGYILY